MPLSRSGSASRSTPPGFSTRRSSCSAGTSSVKGISGSAWIDDRVVDAVRLERQAVADVGDDVDAGVLLDVGVDPAGLRPTRRSPS